MKLKSKITHTQTQTHVNNSLKAAIVQFQYIYEHM